MHEKINWGTVLFDIIVVIVASQTSWGLLLLLIFSGSHKLEVI